MRQRPSDKPSSFLQPIGYGLLDSDSDFLTILATSAEGKFFSFLAIDLTKIT